ncbi:MAG: TIR domain-containing protein [Sphingomonadaceae bacterium]|nr:TIR domain-containing protein [Sphingomonadaceae bacterium]
MANDPDNAAAQRQPVAFISHHSSQVDAARHLARVLERHGIRGWMAPDDIEPGKPFDQVIIEQISKSDVILLLFCSRSDQSKHVKREIMLAEQNHKLIYPIRLETIQPEGLAYWLQDYQWIDWLDQRDEAIERMVRTIRSQLNLPPESPPETAPQPLAAGPAREPAPPSASPHTPPSPARAEGNAAPAPNIVPASPNRWRVLLIPLGLLAVLVLIILIAVAVEMSGGEYDPVPVPTPDPGGGSVAADALKPGRYALSYQLGFFNGGISGGSRAKAEETLAAATREECIGDPASQLAADTARRFFYTPLANCSVADVRAEGGIVSGELQCLGSDNVQTNTQLEGFYTSSSAQVEYVVTQYNAAAGASAGVDYSLTVIANRVGDCAP